MTVLSLIPVVTRVPILVRVLRVLAGGQSRTLSRTRRRTLTNHTLMYQYHSIRVNLSNIGVTTKASI